MSNAEEKSIDFEFTPEGTLVATFCMDTILVGKYADGAGGISVRAIQGKARGCGAYPGISLELNVGGFLSSSRQWIADLLYKAADFLAVNKRPQATTVDKAESDAIAKTFNLFTDGELSVEKLVETKT